jgi:hypothetical protein
MTTSQLYQIKVNTQPIAVITEPQDFDRFNFTEMITFDASDSFDVDVDEGNLKFEWFCHELNKTIGYDMVVDTVRFPAEGWYNVTLYVSDSVHRLDPITKEDSRSSAKVLIYIEVWDPPYGEDNDEDGMDDGWEYDNFLTLGFPDGDEDADQDGYTNYQEYVAQTNPWDKASHPDPDHIPPGIEKDEAPFQFWIFIVIMVAAIFVAGIVVLIGYLRIQRQEQQEKTEEAEEEAMLATPQLDIPSMPPHMQTIMEPGAAADMPAALPPVEQPPAEGGPLPEEPVPEPAPVPEPVPEPVPAPEPAPMEGYQEPPVPEPVPEPVPAPEPAPAQDPITPPPQ